MNDNQTAIPGSENDVEMPENLSEAQVKFKFHLFSKAKNPGAETHHDVFETKRELLCFLESTKDELEVVGLVKGREIEIKKKVSFAI